MYLNAEGHVQWSGIHEYSGLQQLINWRHTFGAALPATEATCLDRLIAAGTARNEAKARGEIVITLTRSMGAPRPLRSASSSSPRNSPRPSCWSPDNSRTPTGA